MRDTSNYKRIDLDTVPCMPQGASTDRTNVHKAYCTACGNYLKPGAGVLLPGRPYWRVFCRG